MVVKFVRSLLDRERWRAGQQVRRGPVGLLGGGTDEGEAGVGDWSTNGISSVFLGTLKQVLPRGARARMGVRANPHFWARTPLQTISRVRSSFDFFFAQAAQQNLLYS